MKNILIITFLCLLFMSCVFAGTVPQQSVQSDGRYVVIMHPQYRAEQYILDTKTGKIWQLVKTNDEILIWEQMLYDCYKEDKTYSGRFTTPR